MFQVLQTLFVLLLQNFHRKKINNKKIIYAISSKYLRVRKQEKQESNTEFLRLQMLDIYHFHSWPFLTYFYCPHTVFLIETFK